MCFTGGFALAMMTEPSVVAPVLSQPSMPIAAGSKKRAAGFDASPAEIACAKARFEDEDLSMIGLRFKSDVLVPDARFETYRRELRRPLRGHRARGRGRRARRTSRRTRS